MIIASTSPWPSWLRSLRTQNEKSKTTETTADAKAALRGTKLISAYGRVIEVRPEKGWAPSDLRIRYLIVAGKSRELFAESMKAFTESIVDWGGLSKDDLWRDPEAAMKIYQVIRAG